MMRQAHVFSNFSLDSLVIPVILQLGSSTDWDWLQGSTS